MRKLRKKFTAFALVGVIVTAIHFCVLILLVEGFTVAPIPATVVGSLISVATSYLLNYRLTFNSAKPHVEAAGKFIIVSTTGMLGNAAIMYFGASVMSWPYLLVQVGAAAVILFWNFFGNYFWSFHAPVRTSGSSSE